MIAKQSIGKSFMGALDYNLKKLEHPDPDQRATLLESNSQSMDRNQILAELAMMKQMNPRLQRNTWHTSLNFPKDDQLTDKDILNVAKEYMMRMEFDNNLYFIFRHHDAGHDHVHILALRNRFDGTVVSDSHNYKRSETIVRDMEKKYYLQQINSSEKAMRRAPTKNEIELALRTGKPSRKMELQEKVGITLKHSKTTDQFIQNLERQNIHPLFNQASTGRVSGISYVYGDFLIKGQKLGRQFTWGNIIKQINYEKTRDSKEISQANDRARGILELERGTANRRTSSAGRGNEIGASRGESAVSGKSESTSEQFFRNRKDSIESKDNSSRYSDSTPGDSKIQEGKRGWKLDSENGLFGADRSSGHKFGVVDGICNDLGDGEGKIKNKRKRKKGIRR
jgi:hypothetical protein